MTFLARAAGASDGISNLLPNDNLLVPLRAPIEKMIRPEQLGKKGESRFEELCAEAGITCNRSEDDTAGWDFLLNMRPPLDETLPLDKRKPSVSCYVQVKTIMSPGGAAKLSLSMAERLAKYPSPSFVCLLVVDESLCFTAAYLMHIIGDRLSNILERLRKAERDNQQKKLHKMSISLSPSPTDAFDLNGRDLAARLQHAVGPDLDAYIASKKQQRDTLGFDEKPYEISVRFDTNDIDEIFDALAGRSKNVPIQISKMVESRFKIPLPYGAIGPATISIHYPVTEQCRIRYTETAGSSPIVFSGTMIRVAFHGAIRLYINCSLMHCVLEKGPNGTKFRFDEASGDAPVDVDSYIGWMKLLNGLIEKKGIVEFAFQETNTRVRLRCADLVPDLAARYAGKFSREYLTLWSDLKDVISYSGEESGLKFYVDDVINSQRKIRVLHSLISGVACKIEMVRDRGPELTLYVGANVWPITFKIGQRLVAAYCVVNIEVDDSGGQPKPTFSRPKLQMIRFLPLSQELQKKFIDEARRFEQIEAVMNVRGSLYFGDDTGPISENVLD